MPRAWVPKDHMIVAWAGEACPKELKIAFYMGPQGGLACARRKLASSKNHALP